MRPKKQGLLPLDPSESGLTIAQKSPLDKAFNHEQASDMMCAHDDSAGFTSRDQLKRKKVRMRSILFLRQFMRNPARTGAIAPSSPALADLITTSADLAKASVVIEFGPGTGVFTEKILSKLQQEATFFALELNPDFVAATRARCPEALVYHDSATQARSYLKTHGHTHCDCIISGLPWAAFAEELQDSILNTISEVLRPGGRFLTFAYLQGLILPSGIRFRRKLETQFAHVRTTRVVWANLPPALVYCVTR